MLSLFRNVLQSQRCAINLIVQREVLPKSIIWSRQPLTVQYGLTASVVPPTIINLLVIKNRNFTSDSSKNSSDKAENTMENKSEKIPVDKVELKKRLTPLQYQVTQEAATERPFTGCYNKHYEKGVYQCIVCHQDLFSSDTKYDSGCGWPAFNDVLDKGKITLHRDASIPERIRTEVRCACCNAHMGHVFEDGPKPTRKRYCINSAAIEFISAEDLNRQVSGVSGASNMSGTVPSLTATPIAQQ